VAASKLAVDLGPWEPQADLRRSLALKMMSVGMPDANKALVEVRNAWSGNRQRLDDMISLIGASWIDLPTAGKLPRAGLDPTGPRALTIKAKEQLIGQMYVVRASAAYAARSPVESWPYAAIDNVVTEPALEDLKWKIRERLKDTLNAASSEDEDIQHVLAQYEQAKEPVFLALPSSVVTPGSLSQLQKDFRTVTFLVLSGRAATLPNWLRSSGWEILDAQPPGDDESRYCTSFLDARDWLCRGARG
jgi:hypothetical protein